MRHSLQFALNRALFKIFGALSKDTYKETSVTTSAFGLWSSRSLLVRILYIMIIFIHWNIKKPVANNEKKRNLT